MAKFTPRKVFSRKFTLYPVQFANGFGKKVYEEHDLDECSRAIRKYGRKYLVGKHALPSSSVIILTAPNRVFLETCAAVDVTARVRNSKNLYFYQGVTGSWLLQLTSRTARDKFLSVAGDDKIEVGSLFRAWPLYRLKGLVDKVFVVRAEAIEDVKLPDGCDTHLANDSDAAFTRVI